MNEELNQKICNKCHRINIEEALFCSSCGTKLTEGIKEDPFFIENKSISIVDKFRKIALSNHMLILTILSALLLIVSIVKLDIIGIIQSVLLFLGCLIFIIQGKKENSNFLKPIKLFKTVTIINIVLECILLLICILTLLIATFAFISISKDSNNSMITYLIIAMDVMGLIVIGITIVYIIIVYKSYFKTFKLAKHSLVENKDLMSKKLLFPAIIMFIVAGSNLSTFFSMITLKNINLSFIFEIIPTEYIVKFAKLYSYVNFNALAFIISIAIAFVSGMILLKLRKEIRN